MDERNARIKAQMAAWQAAFHDRFDAAPPSENDGPRPDKMGDLGCDFRLLTGFSWLTPETRAACLHLLPEGRTIAPMVEDWLGPAERMTEAEAQAALAVGVANVAVAVGDPALGPVAAWDELGYRLPEMAAERGEEAEAAVHFLTELMYWQGSSYTGAHWVCWAVAMPGTENPVASFVALEKGGWQRLAAAEGWDILDRRANADT